MPHRSFHRFVFPLLIFALLTLFAGAQQKPRAASQELSGTHRSVAANSVTEDLSKGAVFTFKIGANLPDFTFKVIPEPQPADEWGNAQSTVRDVEVFRGDSKKPLQGLTGAGCELFGMEPPRRGSDWFRAVDVNFDGYRDIYMMTAWGATGNEYGCVWLYNPATGRFEFSKEFSDLSRYELDPATKTILTFANGGMAGRVYSAAKYTVKNNRPVLFSTESQDWDFDKKQFHCVVKERRGSEMVIVRDEWGKSSDEGPCDPSQPFSGAGARIRPSRN